MLAVDDGGGPHVAARFNGLLSVGIYNLTNAGSWDVALMRWTSNGMLASATSFGAINPDVPTGLAVVDTAPLVAGYLNNPFTFGGCVSTCCSRAVVAGTFGGGIDFANGEAGATSPQDLFLAAIAL